jgi:hypothetical protein
LVKNILPALLICLVIFPGRVFSQEQHAKFLPQHGRLLIIGQQPEVIGDYVRETGVVPGGVMTYTSVQFADGLSSPVDHGGGVQHAQYLIERYPGTAVQIGLYMVGILDEILAGNHDENVRKIADWMKQAGRPIYLRIGYEFDFKDNGYDPEKYRSVFRYIVDRLRAEGVNNVAYVWHTAASVGHPGNFLEWYPGDDYVDWFAVSFFDMQQTATVEKFGDLARQHGKPLMIAESTPVGRYTVQGRKEWLGKFFGLIRRMDIRVACYINSPWDTYPMFKDQKWGDARVQADPEIKALWVKEISSGDYLQSSPDLFDKLSFEQKELKP